QAAAQQQQERARMRLRRGGGGGLSDMDGDPDAAVAGGGGDSGLPSWALPAAGGGRLGVGVGAGTASYTNLGTPSATESGGVVAPHASGEGVGASAVGKRRAHKGGPGALGGAVQKGRPTTADTVASGAGNGSVSGSVANGPTVGGGSDGATGGNSATPPSGRSLNPLLHKSANAKALLAVQATQLSRVLDAERLHYWGNRRRVLHDTAVTAADGNDLPYAYDGDASDADNENEAPPWRGAYGSISTTHVSGNSSSDGRSGRHRHRRRRSRGPRHLPGTGQTHLHLPPSTTHWPSASAPRTVQYLTSRAEPSPPHQPRIPLQPTLGLLPPTAMAFPKVQTYRHRRDGDGDGYAAAAAGSQSPIPGGTITGAGPPQPSPQTSAGGGYPLSRSHPHAHVPPLPFHRSLGSPPRSPQTRQPARTVAPQQPQPYPNPHEALQAALGVDLTPDSEVVETEEPRSLVVAQTPRQRHLLLFRNAQAMVAAAANSRPWVKPLRQPRPSYARPTRLSNPGDGGSGLSASDGGGGGGTSSGGGGGLRSPLRGSVSAGGGSRINRTRQQPPLSPVLRAGGSGSGAIVPLYDSNGAPLSARCNSGGRLPPARPDDRLSRYGSFGRASSAGAAAGAAAAAIASVAAGGIGRILSAGKASGRIRSAG
ncbi:hypothetical protein Vretimale_18619, partial [Volvox reticuliferus]